MAEHEDKGLQPDDQAMMQRLIEELLYPTDNTDDHGDDFLDPPELHEESWVIGTISGFVQGHTSFSTVLLGRVSVVDFEYIVPVDSFGQAIEIGESIP